MTIVLISPHDSLANPGLRILSACLLEEGYDTRMVFLPSAQVPSLLLLDPCELYDGAVVEQVVDLCSDASLVGISVMTNHFDRVKQLTEALRQCLSVPVIWGGIHPTVRPAECLEYADIVCVGEGEQALVELAGCLAQGRSYRQVANLGYRSADGRIVVNPPRPLIQDLDALPFPTFGIENQYVLHEGQIRPLTPTLLHFYLLGSSSTGKPVYPLLSTRGCPHRCSYCANDAYAGIYPSWLRVRRRSNASLVAEIQAFREQFPFVGEIAFYDDVFVAAPTQTIEDFARLYKQQVGLPFFCVVSPPAINERKLTALLDAGLVRMGMGIETGSKHTQDLYSRPIDNEATLKAIRLIHKYADRMMPPNYDVITDNPYEGIQDQLDTLALLQQIPPPYTLSITSLTFYPGTALHERALAEGLIRDEKAEIYNRNFFLIQPTFYNLIIYGFHRRFPRWLLRLMIHPPVFRVLSAPIWRPFWRAVHWGLTRARIWYSTRRLRRLGRDTARLESAGRSTGPAMSGAQPEGPSPDYI